MSLLSLEQIRTGLHNQLNILAPGVYDINNILLGALEADPNVASNVILMGCDYAVTRGNNLNNTTGFPQINRFSENEIFSYDFFLQCQLNEFHTHYSRFSKALHRYSTTVNPLTTSFALQVGGKMGSWIHQQTRIQMILFSTRWDWAIPTNIA